MLISAGLPYGLLFHVVTFYIASNVITRVVFYSRGKPLPFSGPISGIRSVNFTQKADSDDEEEEEVTSQAEADDDVVTVDPEEEEQMSQFMSSNPLERRTLADIIQDKLTEKRTEIHTQMSGQSPTNIRTVSE